jgi:hypothetical protein
MVKQPEEVRQSNVEGKMRLPPAVNDVAAE